ncbi:MAG: hypothetical protein A4S17_13190 [Proteobacteria bacterium HN_bin10]|nr:MAG: hypothetical protein A4S17_13190 [Proteobacteria bacterium HN_bin10]
MRACVLAATLALAACATAPPISEQQSPLAQQIRADNERLDRELAAAGVFAAGIGETANLGGGLIIRPLEIIEDSRCPANVACVWAGRLRLRAEVSGETRELTLGETLATPRGAVLFAVARPGAWADWPEREVARPAYRFGFRRG